MNIKTALYEWLIKPSIVLMAAATVLATLKSKYPFNLGASVYGVGISCYPRKIDIC
ncbi:MAG: hypothetical protein ACI9ES_003027 [Oceanospirillaceae bacterium]|jgi:hypothetical protein